MIELAEFAFEKLEDAVEELEYVSTRVEEMVDQLQDVHHSACLRSKPDLCALAEKIFNRQMTSETNFYLDDAERYADVLGEEGLACYRKLAEAEWKRVLEADEVDKDDPITHIMETLAALSGDVEALVEIKKEYLSTPGDYLDIAKVYQNAGQAESALEWAERGVKAFPDDMRIWDFLIDEYSRRGRYEDALEYAWKAFMGRSNLGQYQQLKTLADPVGKWPELREKALSVIRERIVERRPRQVFTSWSDTFNRSPLVEIYLWENDAESALAEARQGGCSRELWLQLAGRLEETHPEDAIAIYKTQIEDQIEETNNYAYEAAVCLLQKLGRLMIRCERKDEFKGYRESLRKTYFRKRNFVKLLESTRWE